MNVPTGVSLRVLEKQDWQVYRAIRLRALADSPDAFGTTHADALTRTDLEWQRGLVDPETQDLSDSDMGGDDARTAPSDVIHPLLAVVAGEPAGLAWAWIQAKSPAVADIFQMWVAPEFRGRGIGRLLLAELLTWSAGRGVKTARLGVTAGNSNATRLYDAAGFVVVGELEPLRAGSSLRVVSMERMME